MHNRSSFFFFFYFCCVDNGAGWANRGAAHYLQGNSPSLNKHWLSACSCLIFAFICHICLKSFPLHRQKSENIVKKIFPKCSKCLKHRPETGRFTVRFIPLQIKTRRRLWLCGGFFFLFFFPSDEHSQVSSCVSSRMCHTRGSFCSNHSTKGKAAQWEGTRK